MGILSFMVPMAVILSGCGVAAFIWAMRNRQFDDLDTPAYKVLLDEENSKKGMEE